VVGDYWPARSRLGVVESIRALAGDTVVEHPFLDPGFVAALAGSHWRTGFPSRSVALEYVFGDTVPRSVRERADKASFFRPFFNRHSRAFAETWDGAGVDPSLVDAEILREAWNQRDVDARSYAALQSAWLASVRVSA
jgi:asparagine synthase (glutamine-hydrolysing)